MRELHAQATRDGGKSWKGFWSRHGACQLRKIENPRQLCSSGPGSIDFQAGIRTRTKADLEDETPETPETPYLACQTPPLAASTIPPVSHHSTILIAGVYRRNQYHFLRISSCDSIISRQQNSNRPLTPDSFAFPSARTFCSSPPAFAP